MLNMGAGESVAGGYEKGTKDTCEGMDGGKLVLNNLKEANINSCSSSDEYKYIQKVACSFWRTEPAFPLLMSAWPDTYILFECGVRVVKY